MTLRRVLWTILAVGLLSLGACTDDAGLPSVDPSPSASSSASSTPPTASPAPRPARGACYRLGYEQAVGPTPTSKPVPCRTPHTSYTFAVGDLDAVVDGHLLAVDSDRMQKQVGDTCTQRLAKFVGGPTGSLALSMLRPVWFTPTIEESDAGASWYRCDVVAVAADGRLARLSGRLAGVLGTESGRDRYGMCSTAQPGAPGFSRVICSHRHSWRAIAAVPFGGERYPGVAVVRQKGQQPCEDAARSLSGSLTFRWGYEWPSAEQWRAGQHHGLCWVPDS